MQEEEELDTRNGGGGGGGGRRRTWDDEYVLKRQFSALIPAFDPRPGRTNVNQTQDFEIQSPGSGPQTPAAAPAVPSTPDDTTAQPRLQLFIKAPQTGVRSTYFYKHETSRLSII